MRKITFVAICLALVSVASGSEIYVPADFNTIQAAINDANNGDTIIVQTGTYTGDGNRNIDFKGKAITVRSTNPFDPTNRIHLK